MKAAQNDHPWQARFIRVDGHVFLGCPQCPLSLPLLSKAIKGKPELNKENVASSLVCHAMEILYATGDRSAYLFGESLKRPGHIVQESGSNDCANHTILPVLSSSTRNQPARPRQLLPIGVVFGRLRHIDWRSNRI